MSRYKISEDANTDTAEIISKFFSQVVQCERIASSLGPYVKTLRLMKIAYRHVNKAMLALCPNEWQQKQILQTCLEDQAEVLTISEGMVRSLFPRLKNHNRMISDTQALLSDLEAKLAENKAMHEEFEDMQLKGKISRNQEEQIRFMLRDTDRALALISGNVAERINQMDAGTNTLIKDILMRFQDVQKIMASENLEIIDIISSLTYTLPKPKSRMIKIGETESIRIMDEFRQNSELLKSKQRMIAGYKTRHKSNHPPPAKHFPIETKTVQEDSHKENERTKQSSLDEERMINEELRQAASQQMTYERDPMVNRESPEEPSGSTTHNFETETVYAESGRRSKADKRKAFTAFIGYRPQ